MSNLTKVTIEAYSLFEFCKEVQDRIIEGYRFNFESNEMFPTAFGSLLVAGLEKAEAKPEPLPILDSVQEPQLKSKVKLKV
jgi:hypothetical protein